MTVIWVPSIRKVTRWPASSTDIQLRACQAHQADAIDHSFHLDRGASPGRQRRRPSRAGPVGGKAGQLGDAEPGWQGLEPDAIEQDVQGGLVTQIVIVFPARGGPSQTCWPPICKFPDGGTSRSTSSAIRDGSACALQRQRVQDLAPVVRSCPGGPVLAVPAFTTADRGRDWPAADHGSAMRRVTDPSTASDRPPPGRRHRGTVTRRAPPADLRPSGPRRRRRALSPAADRTDIPP